jgi:arabinose-5-phosphate isomerase
LYLKVSDIVQGNPVPVVALNAPLRDVIIEISSKRLGCTAVVNDLQKLQGIITDGDLRRMLQKGSDLEHITAGEIMTAGPKTILPEEFAVKALHQMQENNITQLVVISHEDKVEGFIHLHDLLKEGIV